MTSIRIRYKTLSFWINPAFIEVLSDLICEAFENIGVSSLPKGLQDIYDDCDGNRTGVNIGMVGILFDEYLQTHEEVAIMVDILTETKKLINLEGTILSLDRLNSFEDRKVDEYFKSDWVYPIRTQSLCATVDIIIEMLNGACKYDGREITYLGFPGALVKTAI